MRGKRGCCLVQFSVLLLGVLDEPLENSVDVDLVLCRDGVHADLTALDLVKLTVGCVCVCVLFDSIGHPYWFWSVKGKVTTLGDLGSSP